MQLDGKDKDVPCPVWALLRQMRSSAKATTVDIRLARVDNGTKDLAPLFTELGKLLEKILSYKPGALVAVHRSEVVVDELPVAVTVQDLEDNVVAHRHGNT